MNAVSVRANDESPAEEHSRHDEPAGVATIESYETDGITVFFDAENPLAWMETARTLTLEEFT